jgi:RNA polymerase sigma-70 factor (ECF subfamily)
VIPARDALEARIRAACAGERWSEAATAALEGYGDELLGYLVALARNETDANDAFSTFAEDMWKGLPRFGWQSSFRTWAYTLARHALSRVRRDAFRRRGVALEDAHVAALVEKTRTRTAEFLQTEVRDKLAEIRAQLDPDDQTLLILRINRGLTYREIARVLDGEVVESDDAALGRRANALRKRLERLTSEIKVLVRAGAR